MGGEIIGMTSDPKEQTPEASDIYLDVEHVWQLDPEHDIAQNERRTICAIACMKMIIDYNRPELRDHLSLHAIVKEMKEAGGQDERNYWRHPDQVEYLKNLGFVSFRRNWEAPNSDPKWFAQNEGYNEAQLRAVSLQMQEELQTSDKRQQVLHSLEDQFKLGLPVIVSVKPGFSINKQDHQIVLNGISDNPLKPELYYVDPVLSPKKHQDRQTVDIDYFFEKFNYRAIFAMTHPAYEKFISKQ